MRTLYLDCGMGAAGDMLASALLELLPDGDGFVEKLNSLGIPNVRYVRQTTEKCGIKGTHLQVTVHGVEEHSHDHHHGEETSLSHSHDHHDLEDITTIVHHLHLPSKVEADVLAVYKIIADAESEVHGVPVTEIHFHEVGSMDAIADVTAVSLLMDALQVQRVVASPVHVGAGHVKCAHGILPVPAPATATILKGVPIYGGGVRGELCTPTGAALLRHFVTEFGAMPVMQCEKIGYGMGNKDFATANCIRAMLGTTESGTDSVVEICCNVDDMTAEELSFAMEKILEAGAIDVFAAPVLMKKGRPGSLLTVLCTPDNREQTVQSVFRYTSTIGVRMENKQRAVLSRYTESVKTPLGFVQKKLVEGYGVRRSKYEYEDLKKISEKQNGSISEARDYVERYDG